MLLIFTNITSSLCAFLVLNVAWKARSVSFFLNIKVNAKESVPFLFGIGVILDCFKLVLGMHLLYYMANTIVTKKTQ